MGYMSEEEFNSRLKEIRDKNIEKERRAKLKAESAKYRPKIKLPSTSKLVLLVVFLLCVEIIVFSEYAMIVLGDASAMYVLIGVPTTLVPTVISYYNKSRAENTVNGITYEKTMRELENVKCDTEEDFSDDESVG